MGARLAAPVPCSHLDKCGWWGSNREIDENIGVGPLPLARLSRQTGGPPPRELVQKEVVTKWKKETQFIALENIMIYSCYLSFVCL
jgi:hypothetical protein